MEHFKDMWEFGVVANYYNEIDKTIEINHWLCLEFLLPYAISYPPQRTFSIPLNDNSVLAFRYSLVDIPFIHYGEPVGMSIKNTLVTAAKSSRDAPLVRENTIGEISAGSNGHTVPGSKELYSEVFDISLEYINRFINAYLLVRKEHNIYPVTREILPSTLFSGLCDRNGEHVDMGLFLINFNMPGESQMLSEEEIHRISRMILDDNPFELTEILMLQARREYSSGQYGQAVISAQTSFETFADTLLRLLLEDLGKSALEIENIFDRFGFIPRLKNQFNIIIGGNFSLESGVLKTWNNCTWQVRNTVVHAGYHPTNNEALQAIKAAADGRTYIIKLLKKRPKKFEGILQYL